ncbi:LysR family transcriptional regulator [Labrys neptuniae]
MGSIDHFDLRSFDLNLLVAFDALMQERSVTRAAARLKLGQPAMSHSLSTLRVLMQDELFVRVGAAMQPTARAMVLAGPVREALAQMQAVLRAPTGFDPATEQRTIRFGFSSEVELLLVPELTARLRAEAPGIRLLGRPTASDDVPRLLDDGELDLAIGCFEAIAQRHKAELLFEQELSCVFNPALLKLGQRLGLDDYLALPHVLVTLTERLQGCLDRALDEVDAKLNVVTASSEFLTVLSTVASAPVISTMPTRTARLHAPRFGLKLVPPPLKLSLPSVSLVWPLRLDKELASRWLMGQIRDILRATESVAAAVA